MKDAGFHRSPDDDPSFNACGTITYWEDDRGIRFITTKKERLSLKDLVKYVADNVTYQTIRRMNDKFSQISDAKGGFKKHE